MPKKKIFILLPDGVGLRNFAYTDFYKLAVSRGFDIIFWNDTPFELAKLGYKEIKMEKSKNHPLTNILKKARVTIELDQSIRKTNDTVYDSYRYPLSYATVNDAVKSVAVKVITSLFSGTKGLEWVRKNILRYEQKTPFYDSCLELLRTERPDFVFCSNQRTVPAIAAIAAAKTLGIKTGTFIFSWDNLPKGMMALETDFYFVWSQYMKRELLFYYDYIKDNQIFITGTPQFEPHTKKDNILSRAEFFAQYNLDPNKRYICYSGDDITTSPNDQQFLEDVAKAVSSLNAQGKNLALLFRRCPVDFSDRYDDVLNRYKEIITPVDPKWQKVGALWNSILPTKADLDLQLNTIAHTEMVINLGSSMVFDYVSLDKPCAYINYNPKNAADPNWDVDRIYKFVHFRSMPSKDAVIWLDNPESIAEKINFGFEDSSATVQAARQWFEIVNQHPVDEASSRILDAFDAITNDR